MKISVIVPTLRRPDDLERCLDALALQQLLPDEIVVIVRCDDAPTIERLGAWHARWPQLGLLARPIDEPGVVAAYNLGLDSASGDIVCFTDDDAAPHVDWLQKVHQGFVADPRIGGIGGRDLIYRQGTVIDGAKRSVGLISWYGRMSGNHHIGAGRARQVQVLKGVNMCWRRSAIEGLRFDARLRGSGAQVHCEMAFSLAVVGNGWRLVYDPAVLVDHFHAPRMDEDQRHRFNELAFFNASFNLKLITCEYLPPLRRAAYLLYAVTLGSRDDPGIVRALRLALDADGFALAFRKWRLTMRAMHAARAQAIYRRRVAG